MSERKKIAVKKGILSSKSNAPNVIKRLEKRLSPRKLKIDWETPRRERKGSFHSHANILFYNFFFI